MKTQLCQYGCGQISTHTTKGSLKSGPFKGAPVHQCAKSANSCPAIKAKKVAASVAKYGTEYPWQNKEIIEKRNQSNIEKYGDVNPFNNEGQKAKRKATMLERYGVEQPTLNATIKAKAAAGVKQSFINDPTLKARQNASRILSCGENLEKVVKKTRATRVAAGDWIDSTDITKWENYKRQVMYHTYRNYKKFKSILNPENLTLGRGTYHIDHIYSRKEGFANGVDPTIISHPANLRIISAKENRQKFVRCDQTLEELIEQIKRQDPKVL